MDQDSQLLGMPGDRQPGTFCIILLHPAHLCGSHIHLVPAFMVPYIGFMVSFQLSYIHVYIIIQKQIYIYNYIIYDIEQYIIYNIL